MNAALTFANPEWLLVALLVIPLVVIKAMSDARARAGLESIISPRLRAHLVTARRPLGDWGRFALQALGLILLAIAMARPQKGFTEEMSRVEGRNIIIAIDTSRSMLAEDVQEKGTTSRLQQAKLAAIDLIKALPDDRIGLMAFAGTAMMQAPMTPDHSAVIETVDQLNTYVIERGGTNLAAAIDLASKRLGASSAARNALIMFTDGDDLEGVALKSAKKAHRENVTIITIGVGSATPTIVPDPESGKLTKFLKDESGELVKSGMDPESLEKIAKATSGSFITLKPGIMNKQLVESVLANISSSQSEDRLKRTPRERFFLPLLLGLACIAGAFIATLWGSRPPARPAIAALLLLGFFDPEHLQASAASEAYAAYTDGDYEKAHDHYLAAAEKQKEGKTGHEIVFGRGSAAYQLGEYDIAVQAFGNALTSPDEALQERSHYNLGNTLFRRGEAMWKDEKDGGLKKFDEVTREWNDARDHYKDALAINAENEDAQTNLDIVEALLEKLEQLQEKKNPEEQPKQEEEKKEEEKKQEEEKPEEKQEQQDKEKGEEEGDKPEEKPEPEAGDQGEEKPEAGEDGKEQKSEGDAGEEESQEPNETDGGNEEGEMPDDAQEGDQDGKNPTGEGEPTDENADGEASAEDAAPDPDDEIDEKTGYSKNQARENLEKLSDEQRDLGLLRRRQLRMNPTRYRDW